LSDEKCVNCGKTKAEHHHIGDKIWCSASHRDLRTWKQPEPQAALFDASAVRTGYEL
jgi:hypothetical protein